MGRRRGFSIRISERIATAPHLWWILWDRDKDKGTRWTKMEQASSQLLCWKPTWVTGMMGAAWSSAPSSEMFKTRLDMRKLFRMFHFFVPKHGSRCEAAQTSALKTCDSGGCPHLSTNLHGFTTSYCRPLPDEVARKRQASARRANSWARSADKISSYHCIFLYASIFQMYVFSTSLRAAGKAHWILTSNSKLTTKQDSNVEFDFHWDALWHVHSRTRSACICFTIRTCSSNVALLRPCLASRPLVAQEPGASRELETKIICLLK